MNHSRSRSEASYHLKTGSAGGNPRPPVPDCRVRAAERAIFTYYSLGPVPAPSRSG